MGRWIVVVPFFAASILMAGLLASSSPAQRDSASRTDIPYGYVPIVRVTFVSGDVQLIHAEDREREPAVADMLIQPGSSLITNNGRAEIEVGRSVYVWVAEGSHLEAVQAEISNTGYTNSMTLRFGTATFSTNLGADDSFTVVAPGFRVHPLLKSEFRVDALDPTGSVRVSQGGLSVNSARRAQSVEPGQRLTVMAGMFDQPTQDPHLDAWDQWVQDRFHASRNSVTPASSLTGESNRVRSMGVATAAGSPSFNLTLSPSSVTIPFQGASGQATLRVTPIGDFNGPISLTRTACSGLPPASGCSFSPSSLAGGGTSIVTFITTAPMPNTSTVPTAFGLWAPILGIGVIACVVAALLFLRLHPSQRRFEAVLALLVLAMLVTFSSCGGGVSPGGIDPGNGGLGGTPSGVYNNVKITVTSGSAASSVTFQIVVVDDGP